jgi:hypothetical protein
MKLPGVEDFRIELATDSNSRKLVLFLCDASNHPISVPSESIKSISIAYTSEQFEVQLTPVTTASDAKGHASRFEINADQLPQQIWTTNEFVIRVPVSRNGQVSVAELRHRNDHEHSKH